MFLLDKYVFTGIVDITQDILKNYFFYDNESLNNFFDDFVNCMANEYTIFHQNVDFDFKRQLRFDLNTRRHFTSYFVSWHLHDLLVNNLHFTDMELDLFENILPKFVGVYDVKQQGI